MAMIEWSDADKSSYEEEAKALRNVLGYSERSGCLVRRNAIPMEYLFQVFQLSEAEASLLLLGEFERHGPMCLLQDDYKEKYPRWTCV